MSIGVMGAVVLAVHDDAAGHVGNAHGGIGFSDVLSAGAAGAVGVDPQVGRVDIDFYRVVDFGIDKDAGKRCVAPVGGIKGAFAHEAVHARFGAQEPERVIALDFDRRRLDAGDFAVGLDRRGVGSGKRV